MYIQYLASSTTLYIFLSFVCWSVATHWQTQCKVQKYGHMLAPHDQKVSKHEWDLQQQGSINLYIRIIDGKV